MQGNAQVDAILVILSDMMASVDQKATEGQSDPIQIDPELIRQNLNKISLKLEEHVQLAESQAQFHE